MSPELQAQLVDPADATYAAGSNTKLAWRCPVDPRHVWTASPNTRKRSGCPVCRNKLVLPGVNDLATTDAALATQLLDTAQATKLHRGSHTKAWWQCAADPAHRWQASVVSRVRLGAGCPYCSGRKTVVGRDDLAATRPDVAAQLVDPSQAHGVAVGSSTKLLWRCTSDPDHTWLAPVRHRTGAGVSKVTGCPHCAGRTQRQPGRLASLGELRSPLLEEAVDPDLASRLSSGSGKVISWRCDSCASGHTYEMSVRHRMRGQGCPVLAGTTVLAGFNDLATTHASLAAELVDPSLASTLSRGSTSAPLWRCSQGHQWNAAVYARVAGNGCPHCSPIGSSYGEHEVLAVLRTVDPTTRHRVRLPGGTGHGVEVDIQAGDLAVEFNGVYWHSEAAGRDRRAHQAKHAAIAKAGLQLLTVWEDDWSKPERREIIVRTLAHRLGASSSLENALKAAGLGERFEPMLVERLGARKLDPVELNLSATDAFFDSNHVQGKVALTRSFALLDEQARPRAVLGLRSPRHNARASRAAGHWEIQRYATRGIIPGGFSRLLAHARQVLTAEGIELDAWVTLSADESFTGGLYAATGFEIDGQVRPSYWYAGGPLRGRRAPKEAFQLRRFRQDPDLAYEEGWSEREAAAANRMYRVWDAGKTRWIRHLI